ncbi:hypothetical protein A3H38_02000 [candidate division WOR-1 bacterium RIFCSPLOWO2_02_FULL_46_20]|uniref:DUF5678 domain-containing protein n=2 Tax=Saganbacteria TaxID=1703751 RepID=A0A1F4R8G8_UNCSA|nr:MAG: hypothetical protein A3J44_05510 [candidate division WOR-1 bacterium RIFCSPHIGHO2_02_FULL_45_12]OGC04450.1 MAG: hypothetical protein A3H38_02000 [candidate division WOR-1 bacterium RIFCSPLOWO2_02_FULL_46_20]OGC09602.1 MAG: hypothetical protein A3F86_06375 [candidate division WOR-1 bacterium RIFCSPLOWO2_12_FULL_45_9]
MENTLVKDEKHGGRFVALKDFGDKTVIVDGKNPSEVLEKAINKGYQNPVILFVPVRDMVQIY